MVSWSSIKMSQFDVQLEFMMLTSPEKVFQTLTNPEIISQWSEAPATFSLQVDGSYEMFGGWTKGKILSFTIPAHLSYTWWVTDWDQATPPSTVIYQLLKDEKGTKVLLEHKNFPNQESAESHKSGWSSEFFDKINEYFAK